MWQGTKFAVFFISVSSYRYLSSGGTNKCEILHDGKYRSFLGQCPQGISQIQNFGQLMAHILKIVRCSVTCQLQLNISSMRPF